MKSIPNSLLQFLLSTDVQSCFYADLFTITLTSGRTLFITDGQMLITYQGNVYEPSKYGFWKCTATSTSLGVMQASATLKVLGYDEHILPVANVPIMQAIQLGLFDAATILIRTTYGLTYGETDFGTVVRFGGTITDLQKTGRTSADGTCKPNSYTLNQNMPRRVIQPGCGWVFGDAGCTVDKTQYQVAAAVAVGTTSKAIAAGLTQPDGYFTQGTITFTSGQNTGLSVFVQSYASGVLNLVKPPILPMKTGDTFIVTTGCDHTIPTCQGRYDNLINYGGTPYIPSREFAL